MLVTLKKGSAAFLVAATLHGGLLAGAWQMNIAPQTPPIAVGGFEVVDLSAFGQAAPPEPEGVQDVVEHVLQKEETFLEPVAQPIIEKSVDVVPVKVKPRVQPVALKKPKPPIPRKEKVFPKKAPKKKIVTAKIEKKTKTTSPASIGSQHAYVPPSSKAAYLRNPKPIYPKLAHRRGIEGVVFLLVDVSAQGRVLGVQFKKRSGSMLLDNAAMQAVKNWRFAPASKGGRAVRASVEVPISFSLTKI